MGEGEAVLLRSDDRSPTATCCCQRTLPVGRSRQISKRFPLSSGLVTNTESSQTTGVAWLAPGRATDQSTLSLVVQLSGKPRSVVEPLRNGPRHCGQFSAETVNALKPSSR